jgi:mercuric ion transport protein
MNKQKDKTWIAGVLLALTASLCCLTPVLALLSGIGGIAATFSFLEPARPYLISITVFVLGFAWYQKLKPRKKEEIECDCEEDGKTSFWQSKSFLAIVTILAIGLLAFPRYSHIFYAKNEKASTGTNDPVPAATPLFPQDESVSKIELNVKGMTCSGCEEHVRHAVNGLDGILQASASYHDGKAIIHYDVKKTSPEQIKAAINGTGYKVIDPE